MNLYPIEAGNFKLDGGAMFGVVPKSIWQKTNPADNNNLIDIAARCLLIEDGNRLTLIDNGMGDKQSDKFFGYYHQWGDFSIENSLKKYGFHKDDITDVFMNLSKYFLKKSSDPLADLESRRLSGSIFLYALCHPTAWMYPISSKCLYSTLSITI